MLTEFGGIAGTIHVPCFLRQCRNTGEAKMVLLLFDGLAFDRWVCIKEHLIIRRQPPLAFDKNTAFVTATATSVSRQALFSGLQPREFDDSIGHANNVVEGVLAERRRRRACRGDVPAHAAPNRATGRTAKLEIADRESKALGWVIDEVDERLHKERNKEDVALWIGRWLGTGFVERLFTFLLGEGFSIYVMADHGNVDAVGVGRSYQGVIAETRGERVREIAVRGCTPIRRLRIRVRSLWISLDCLRTSGLYSRAEAMCSFPTAIRRLSASACRSRN